ncbi:hypothetical protein IJI99_02640 [bacterium]|nr:hypothetical protein [bacterium]
MREEDILSDAALQEATYGRISGDQPEEEQQPENSWDELPVMDYSQVPDFSEKLLFTWVAPERAFRPRLSKSYKRNLVLLLILIVLLLIFMNQLALLIVSLSLIFLTYVLVNVPPQRIRHTITNYGIYAGNHFYPWLERGKRFWWEENNDQMQMVFETQRFPYRVVMMVGHPRNQEHLQEVMSHYMVFQKPEPTDLDKFIAWWREKFPME